MYTPDENDIDRLSREAAEHYHAPGVPSWDAMRQSLDKEIPLEKEKKRRGFLFFFLALGLLAGGTGLWYGIHSNKTTEKIAGKPTHATTNASAGAKKIISDAVVTKDNTGASSRTIQPSPNSTISTAKEIQGTNIPVHASVGEPTTVQATDFSSPASGTRIRPVTKDNVPVQKDAYATNTRTHGSSMHKKYHQQPLTGKYIALPESESSKYTNGSKGKKNKSVSTIADADEPIAREMVTGDTKDGTHAINNAEIPVLPHDSSNTAGQQPIAPKKAMVEKTVAITDKTDSAKTAVVKNKAKNEKAILVGLTAGLDLSTVKFRYGSGTGYNIGLLGGYQFSKHWSAYTGVVYTKKIYKLNGNDYHPPKDYWTMYVNLETVAGYCRMWELPLLARYTFNPQSKTAFFVSAGMSSYFMKKQQYTYVFKTNMMEHTANWSNDSAFNHIFSILDLSAGFQKRVGKHMNWQVEPYARIPLGGVGFGNIRLSSFGLNLTIQYRHPVKR